MKKYTNIHNFDAEKFAKEGKMVFCLDKEEKRLYDIRFISAEKFWDVQDDRNNRYHCWIEEYIDKIITL